MPSTLTTEQIVVLKEQVNSGDVSGAYSYLYEQGYDYAGWANRKKGTDLFLAN